MLSIRLPHEIEMKLEKAVMATKRTKSYFVKEALTSYLDDLEDLCITLDRLAKPKAKYYKTSDVRKKLGL